MDDLDLYDDLDEFREQQEKKSKELQDAEDKYADAIKTIQSMEEEIKGLKKKIQRIELSFQSLLDTARAEIKRKDKEIERLRKEKDDICFRRKLPNRTEATLQATALQQQTVKNHFALAACTETVNSRSQEAEGCLLDTSKTRGRGRSQERSSVQYLETQKRHCSRDGQHATHSYKRQRNDDELVELHKSLDSHREHRWEKQRDEHREHSDKNERRGKTDIQPPRRNRDRYERETADEHGKTYRTSIKRSPERNNNKKNRSEDHHSKNYYEHKRDFEKGQERRERGEYDKHYGNSTKISKRGEGRQTRSPNRKHRGEDKHMLSPKRTDSKQKAGNIATTLFEALDDAGKHNCKKGLSDSFPKANVELPPSHQQSQRKEHSSNCSDVGVLQHNSNEHTDDNKIPLVRSHEFQENNEKLRYNKSALKERTDVGDSITAIDVLGNRDPQISTKDVSGEDESRQEVPKDISDKVDEKTAKESKSHDHSLIANNKNMSIEECLYGNLNVNLKDNQQTQSQENLKDSQYSEADEIENILYENLDSDAKKGENGRSKYQKTNDNGHNTDTYHFSKIGDIQNDNVCEVLNDLSPEDLQIGTVNAQIKQKSSIDTKLNKNPQKFGTPGKVALFDALFGSSPSSASSTTSNTILHTINMDILSKGKDDGKSSTTTPSGDNNNGALSGKSPEYDKQELDKCFEKNAEVTLRSPGDSSSDCVIVLTPLKDLSRDAPQLQYNKIQLSDCFLKKEGNINSNDGDSYKSSAKMSPESSSSDSFVMGILRKTANDFPRERTPNNCMVNVVDGIRNSIQQEDNTRLQNNMDKCATIIYSTDSTSDSLILVSPSKEPNDGSKHLHNEHELNNGLAKIGVNKSSTIISAAVSDSGSSAAVLHIKEPIDVSQKLLDKKELNDCFEKVIESSQENTEMLEKSDKTSTTSPGDSRSDCLMIVTPIKEISQLLSENETDNNCVTTVQRLQENSALIDKCDKISTATFKDSGSDCLMPAATTNIFEVSKNCFANIEQGTLKDNCTADKSNKDSITTPRDSSNDCLMIVTPSKKAADFPQQMYNKNELDIAENKNASSTASGASCMLKNTDDVSQQLHEENGSGGERSEENSIVTSSRSSEINCNTKCKDSLNTHADDSNNDCLIVESPEDNIDVHQKLRNLHEFNAEGLQNHTELQNIQNIKPSPVSSHYSDIDCITVATSSKKTAQKTPHNIYDTIDSDKLIDKRDSRDNVIILANGNTIDLVEDSFGDEVECCGVPSLGMISNCNESNNKGRGLPAHDMLNNANKTTTEVDDVSAAETNGADFVSVNIEVHKDSDVTLKHTESDDCLEIVTKEHYAVEPIICISSLNMATSHLENSLKVNAPLQTMSLDLISHKRDYVSKQSNADTEHTYYTLEEKVNEVKIINKLDEQQGDSSSVRTESILFPPSIPDAKFQNNSAAKAIKFNNTLTNGTKTQYLSDESCKLELASSMKEPIANERNCQKGNGTPEDDIHYTNTKIIAQDLEVAADIAIMTGPEQTFIQKTKSSLSTVDDATAEGMSTKTAVMEIASSIKGKAAYQSCGVLDIQHFNIENKTQHLTVASDIIAINVREETSLDNVKTQNFTKGSTISDLTSLPTTPYANESSASQEDGIADQGTEHLNTEVNAHTVLAGAAGDETVTTNLTSLINEKITNQSYISHEDGAPGQDDQHLKILNKGQKFVLLDNLEARDGIEKTTSTVLCDDNKVNVSSKIENGDLCLITSTKDTMEDENNSKHLLISHNNSQDMLQDEQATNVTIPDDNITNCYKESNQTADEYERVNTISKETSKSEANAEEPFSKSNNSLKRSGRVSIEIGTSDKIDSLQGSVVIDLNCNGKGGQNSIALKDVDNGPLEAEEKADSSKSISTHQSQADVVASVSTVSISAIHLSNDLKEILEDNPSQNAMKSQEEVEFMHSPKSSTASIPSQLQIYCSAHPSSDAENVNIARTLSEKIICEPDTSSCKILRREKTDKRDLPNLGKDKSIDKFHEGQSSEDSNGLCHNDRNSKLRYSQLQTIEENIQTIKTSINIMAGVDINAPAQSLTNAKKHECKTQQKAVEFQGKDSIDRPLLILETNTCKDLPCQKLFTKAPAENVDISDGLKTVGNNNRHNYIISRSYEENKTIQQSAEIHPSNFSLTPENALISPHRQDKEISQQHSNVTSRRKEYGTIATASNTISLQQHCPEVVPSDGLCSIKDSSSTQFDYIINYEQNLSLVEKSSKPFIKDMEIISEHKLAPIEFVNGELNSKNKEYGNETWNISKDIQFVAESVSSSASNTNEWSKPIANTPDKDAKSANMVVLNVNLTTFPTDGQELHYTIVNSPTQNMEPRPNTPCAQNSPTPSSNNILKDAENSDANRQRVSSVNILDILKAAKIPLCPLNSTPTKPKRSLSNSIVDTPNSLKTSTISDSYGTPNILPSIPTKCPTPPNFSGIFSKRCVLDSSVEDTQKCKKPSPKPKSYVLPAASVLCNVDNLENATKPPKKLHWKSLSNKNEVTEIDDDTDIDEETSLNWVEKGNVKSNKPIDDKTAKGFEESKKLSIPVGHKSLIARRNTIDTLPAKSAVSYKALEELEHFKELTISPTPLSTVIAPCKVTKNRLQNPTMTKTLKTKLMASSPIRVKSAESLMTTDLLKAAVIKTNVISTKLHTNVEKEFNLVANCRKAKQIVAKEQKMLPKDKNNKKPNQQLVGANVVNAATKEGKGSSAEKALETVPMNQKTEIQSNNNEKTDSNNVQQKNYSNIEVATTNDKMKSPKCVKTLTPETGGTKLSPYQYYAENAAPKVSPINRALLSGDTKNENAVTTNESRSCEESPVKTGDNCDKNSYEKSHSSDEQNSSVAENSEPECNKFLKEDEPSKISKDCQPLLERSKHSASNRVHNNVDHSSKLASTQLVFKSADKSALKNYKIPKLQNPAEGCSSSTNKIIPLDDIGVKARTFKGHLSTFRIPKTNRDSGEASKNSWVVESYIPAENIEKTVKESTKEQIRECQEKRVKMVASSTETAEIYQRKSVSKEEPKMRATCEEDEGKRNVAVSVPSSDEFKADVFSSSMQRSMEENKARLNKKCTTPGSFGMKPETARKITQCATTEGKSSFKNTPSNSHRKLLDTNSEDDRLQIPNLSDEANKNVQPDGICEDNLCGNPKTFKKSINLEKRILESTSEDDAILSHKQMVQSEARNDHKDAVSEDSNDATKSWRTSKMNEDSSMAIKTSVESKNYELNDRISKMNRDDVEVDKNHWIVESYNSDIGIDKMDKQSRKEQIRLCQEKGPNVIRSSRESTETYQRNPGGIVEKEEQKKRTICKGEGKKSEAAAMVPFEGETLNILSSFCQHSTEANEMPLNKEVASTGSFDMNPKAAETNTLRVSAENDISEKPVNPCRRLLDTSSDDDSLQIQNFNNETEKSMNQDSMGGNHRTVEANVQFLAEGSKTFKKSITISDTSSKDDAVSTSKTKEKEHNWAATDRSNGTTGSICKKKSMGSSRICKNNEVTPKAVQEKKRSQKFSVESKNNESNSKISFSLGAKNLNNTDDFEHSDDELYSMYIKARNEYIRLQRQLFCGSDDEDVPNIDMPWKKEKILDAGNESLGKKLSTKSLKMNRKTICALEGIKNVDKRSSKVKGVNENGEQIVEKKMYNVDKRKDRNTCGTNRVQWDKNVREGSKTPDTVPKAKSSKSIQNRRKSMCSNNADIDKNLNDRGVQKSTRMVRRKSTHIQSSPNSCEEWDGDNSKETKTLKSLRSRRKSTSFDGAERPDNNEIREELRAMNAKLWNIVDEGKPNTGNHQNVAIISKTTKPSKEHPKSMCVGNDAENSPPAVLNAFENSSKSKKNAQCTKLSCVGNTKDNNTHNEYRSPTQDNSVKALKSLRMHKISKQAEKSSLASKQEPIIDSGDGDRNEAAEKAQSYNNQELYMSEDDEDNTLHVNVNVGSNRNSKSLKPLRNRRKSVHVETQQPLVQRLGNDDHISDSSTTCIITQKLQVRRNQVRRKSLNLQRRILDTSSDEECDEKKIAIPRNPVIQNNCAVPSIPPATELKRSARKRRVVKVLSTSLGDSQVSKKPKYNLDQEETNFPVSPTLSHPIFHTHVAEKPEMYVSTAPFIHDARFKEIDSTLHDMFQSPQHEIELNKSFVSQESMVISMLPESQINNSGTNVTIDETVYTNGENDGCSVNISCPTDSKSLNSSALQNQSETKHLSLGTSEYRFEKVSENVVNLFISRKRKRNKQTN